jgi:tRNA (mo5U34)-methyltransferase
MKLREALRGRRPKQDTSELAAELASPIPWMYRWDVGGQIVGPPESGDLATVHETRRRMIEPVVREALAAAGPGASVLDLGCNEGWFAQLALEWGAERVLGVDVRELNVLRARLMRDHKGIAPERLQLEQLDVHAIDPARLGTFDVVLVLGLIYHLENPIGALRTARALSHGTVVVESQLTAHYQPIRHGWGETDVFRDAEAHWAAVLEPAEEQAPEGNLLSSYGGVLSLVPNRAALVQALEVVGYQDVRVLAAPANGNRQYCEGHRAIAAGRAPARG